MFMFCMKGFYKTLDAETIHSSSKQKHGGMVEGNQQLKKKEHASVDQKKMSTETKIDENLYSRQIYVLGLDAMKKMFSSEVLICGMNGIGVELAKNVILSGVKSVYLNDQKNISWMDLSSNFYADAQSIGMNRADCVVKKLKELNEYVKIEKLEGPLNEKSLLKFSVVVFCDTPAEELININNFCHENRIKFICIENKGLAASIFCDFGKGFEINDVDGEPLITNIVTSISNGQEAVVTVHDDKRTHGYYDGDLVVFDEVQGMSEINNLPPAEVISTGKHYFKVKIDTTKFGEYTTGGVVSQVKKPKILDFKPLGESIKNPECIETDFGKFGRGPLLNEGFIAINQFSKAKDHLPRPYNVEDAEQIVEIVNKNRSSPLSEDEAKIIMKLSFTSRGNLNPLVAFLGGFGGQEVLKAISGKFHPINQWMFIDAFECIPEPMPKESSCAALNCRYDGQIAVFGVEFQKKLANMNLFVVGAGALGCEYLKNIAMMGASTAKQATTFVTDLDSIEVSNLSRQFLFRRKHVGKMKSEVAAAAAVEMNPELHIKPMQDKLGRETETIFNDDYWESIQSVFNALDNVASRLYVDSKCVFYQKPLIEAGTLGAKANVQIVVPKLTESYGSSQDPPESSIPICTLKNFPNEISHCIQWGRDLFQGYFRNAPQDVNKFLSSPNYIQELETQGGSIKQNLENVYDNLVQRPITFEHCVQWARVQFETLYNHNIKQLIYSFPADMLTSSGTPFWAPPKRCPTPLVFDWNDKQHRDFIIAAANLRAEIFGIKQHRFDYDYEKVLTTMPVPEFKPKAGAKIETEEKKEKEPEKMEEEPEGEGGVDQETLEIEEMKKRLPKQSQYAGFRLKEIEFEKDDDTNFHIDFITAASNLRGRNYKIREADRHTTKGIAGKIIPAMITTTALITGLGCIEFYKLALGKNKLDDYRNSFVNIALPLVTMSDPIKAPEITMHEGRKWNLWEKFDIDAGKDISLSQLMSHFKNKEKLLISMLTFDKAILYNAYGNPNTMKERCKLPIMQAIELVTKTKIPDNQKYAIFEICASDLDDNDVDVPAIRYKLHREQ